jgi:hypothetical protein
MGNVLRVAMKNSENYRGLPAPVSVQQPTTHRYVPPRPAPYGAVIQQHHASPGGGVPAQVGFVDTFFLSFLF